MPRVPLNTDIASFVLYAVPIFRSSPIVAVPVEELYVKAPDAKIKGLIASDDTFVMPI